MTTHHVTWEMTTAWIAQLLGIGVLLMLAGCREEVQISTAKSNLDQLAAAKIEKDHVRAAMELLEDYDRHQQELLLGRVLHHLREWTETQNADVDWLADPMFARLPARLNLSKNPNLLARRQFGRPDVEMLRETRWIHDVAVRVSESGPLDAELQIWLNETPRLASDDNRRDLRSAIVIFDWLVRNIQIESMWLDVNAERVDETQPADHPFAGIERRPGIRRTAWEALLLGRGDALCRGRLLILMLRQLGIPAVMLAEDKENEPPPWCLAVQVGDELFLFDAEQGLPIPGEEGRGVVTLRELTQAPELLADWGKQLERTYPVRTDAGTTQWVPQVALVDATAGYLSQRMRLLETALPSENRLILTTVPSDLRRVLLDQPGIGDVRIWTQPYDADAFRQIWGRYPSVIQRWQQEMAPLSAPWPLSFARRQHLRGVFTDPERDEGAMQLYMRLRPSDVQIAALSKPEGLVAYMQELVGGAYGLPADPALRQQFTEATRKVALYCRAASSFWLGLVAWEKSDYRVAADYFQFQVLERDAKEAWEVGAWYNLGRAYESLGLATGDAELLRKAITCFEHPTGSPQDPGNRLRARRLELSK